MVVVDRYVYSIGHLQKKYRLSLGEAVSVLEVATSRTQANALAMRVNHLKRLEKLALVKHAT